MKRTLIVFSMLAILSIVSQVPSVAAMPFATIRDSRIQLEVASTPKQIELGLMYRTALPENQGMVFLFPPGQGVRFWMAHCFISLDMLMIKDGKIVRIFHNVPPCRESDTSKCPTYPLANEPEIAVDQVIEVIGGYAKRHGIKEGDAVSFSMSDVAHGQQPAK